MMTIPLRRYWGLLARYLLPLWPRALLLGVLLGVTIALELVSPQIVRHFIDTARAGGATAQLTLAAGLFIVVALGAEAAGVAETYVAENLSWSATNRLRAD